METRIKLVYLGFILAFLAVILRLFYWQVIKAKELANQARKQYQIGQSLLAPRGNIISDDGSLLVGKQDGWLVYAYLPEISLEKDEIADLLAPFFIESIEGEKDDLLFQEAGRIKSLFSKDNLVWIPLQHHILREVKENIEALSLDGIGFEEEDLRVYPEASSAAHLLGFLGKNVDGIDKGYFGLEGYYDLILSGKPGFISRDMDAQGSPIIVGDLQEIGAVEGVDLVTNINKGIQLMAEKKLKEGIEKYGASAGSVIVMEPKTGAIKAMSSFPNYDPAEYTKYSDELFKNPCISDSFEPGSVFKVLVMASALDAQAVKPETKCEICSGPVKIDKYTIETWNEQYFPDSSMVDVIVHSDNVGMTFVGDKLGKEKMYEYLDRFGIGKLTGVDLQGEATPILRDKNSWGKIDIATASFGQGIALTPLQLISAVSTIANKGISARPFVVKKLQSDGWNEDIKPILGERVISEKAAEEISLMMAEAAKSGEAKWTHLTGFKVAGKTGTAQIPISGHYDQEKTIASFIGFAPFDDPKFIMLVTLREPQTSPWASETAAPLWYDIAKDLFIYYKIIPEK